MVKFSTEFSLLYGCMLIQMICGVRSKVLT